MTSVEKKNEVYLRIGTEQHIHHEISEYFTFEVPEAKFLQQQRRYRRWDGKIRLYSPGTGELYVGLYDYLVDWLRKMGYTYTINDSEHYGKPGEENASVSPQAVAGFVRSLGLPFKARDYQLAGIYKALRFNRRLILAPTGSGKSLIIYCLVRWHRQFNREVLIIVPTTSLVEQMYKDFEDYGWDASKFCHKIYGGRDLLSDLPVTISTWQSIYKQDRKWFRQYGVVIGDEAHQYKSKSLVTLMTKLDNAKYRYGFTGTLDGTQTHKWVLEGLFGPSYKIINTRDLQEAGYLAKLNIRCLLLKHNPRKFDTYEDEVQYLITHDSRNKFIKNLALDLKGNTLILYSRVAQHGEVLYNLINTNDRKVFFVHGGVDTEERESVRQITEEESDAIIVASYGTFSTGTVSYTHLTLPTKA